MAERKSRTKAVNLVSPPEVEVSVTEDVEEEGFITRQKAALDSSEYEEAWDETALEVANQEFNEHVKSLVNLFFEEKISGLDERIRDLELLVGQLTSQRAPLQDPVQQTVEAPSYFSDFPDYANGDVDIPEYRPPSEESGSNTPWYHG